MYAASFLSANNPLGKSPLENSSLPDLPLSHSPLPNNPLALILSGGTYAPVPAPLIEEAAFVVACDKGLQYALAQEISVDLWVGDGDSLVEALGQEEEGADCPSPSQVLQAENKDPSQDLQTEDQDLFQDLHQDPLTELQARLHALQAQYPQCLKNMEVLALPCHKDESDTLQALLEVYRRGYRRLELASAFGGRMDHAYANLQTLVRAKELGFTEVVARDTQTTLTVLQGGDTLSFMGPVGLTFSLFSYSEECQGVSIQGAAYPLDKGTLTQTFPLGLSNKIAPQEEGESQVTGHHLSPGLGQVNISLDEGYLLVFVNLDASI